MDTDVDRLGAFGDLKLFQRSFSILAVGLRRNYFSVEVGVFRRGSFGLNSVACH